MLLKPTLKLHLKLPANFRKGRRLIIGFQVTADELIDLPLPCSYGHFKIPPRKSCIKIRDYAIFAYGENQANIIEDSVRRQGVT